MELKCRECNKARGMHHTARCSVRTGRKAVREEDCHDPVHPEEAALVDKVKLVCDVFPMTNQGCEMPNCTRKECVRRD